MFAASSLLASPALPCRRVSPRRSHGKQCQTRNAQRFSPRFSPRTATTMTAAGMPSDDKPKEAIVQLAEEIGLPVDEGLFGFNPFAEKWVGRLAMAGFLTAFLEEVWTGKGILGQLGFDVPSAPLATALVGLATTATAVSTFVTIFRALQQEMSPAELARYQNFFGMRREDFHAVRAEAAFRRGDTDFTGPQATVPRVTTAADAVLGMTSLTAAAEAKRDGSPADAILAGLTVEDLDAEAAAIKTRGGAAPAPQAILYDFESVAAERALMESFMQQVEMTNGRWAMLGFLAAASIESVTGLGMIQQMLGYAKVVGLLGQASGF